MDKFTEASDNSKGTRTIWIKASHVSSVVPEYPDVLVVLLHGGAFVRIEDTDEARRKLDLAK